MKKIFQISFLALVLLFIYAPILLLTVYSFNKSETITSWEGFSWDHYKYFFSMDKITKGVQSTICPTISGIKVDLGNPIATNKKAREIAVTTSALITGIWFMLESNPFVLFLE